MEVSKKRNIRILTGSISQIVDWIENNHDITVFEVTGYLVGLITPGPAAAYRFMLRDRKESGPILQVIQPYYLFPDNPKTMEFGIIVRCMGKIIDAKTMLAMKINTLTPDEANDYTRLGHVCRSTKY